MTIKFSGACRVLAEVFVDAKEVKQNMIETPPNKKK